MNGTDLLNLIFSYENTISTSIIPDSIIDTSLTRYWLKSTMDPERNLLNPSWMVRTADPKLISSANRALNFEVPLAFTLHSTPDLGYLSSLRRRLFFLEILKGTGTKRQASAASAIVRMLDVDWFFRWCNANSIFHYGDLTEDHLTQFEEDSSSGDVVDLLPLVSWLDELLEEPGFELPKYAHGTKYRLSWEKIASTLGVTSKSLALSRRFMKAFEKLTCH